MDTCSAAKVRPKADTTGDDSARRLRLCVLATIGKSIQILYAGRLEYLAANGFDITAACASSEDDEAIVARGVRLKTFPFTRAVTPWADVRACLQLYRFLREEPFDIVEVSTPKAALIGSLAARMARCPCRIHLLHGMPYEGRRGLLGAVLRASTWIPSHLTHVTFAVSPSLRERLCADGLARPERVRVLGAGSANGVDVRRFAPERIDARASVRAACGVPSDAVVIGFVGRLTRDKGIEELARAFVAVHAEAQNVVLMVVGEYEDRDRPSPEIVRVLSTHPGVRHVGWRSDVVPSMAAMDIVVLPTRREGLGNVLLEAAALGLPTVTTDATGARDALLPGVTGLQVPVGDVKALGAALARLARDPLLRSQMGRAGRRWVCERFDQEDVWRRQAREYRALAAAASATAHERRPDANLSDSAVKRSFDAVVSLVLLVALSPVLAAIAVGVKLSSRGPALFRQTRAGMGGQPFTLYKFRSMDAAPAASLETWAEDPRVFRFGRFLREYHLDELPQLWNVLKGDMSLVGPRPTLPEQVERYTERQRRRLNVRPGITGLAQVSGNNALEWPRRIEVDLEYVGRADLRTDLAILWRTLATVLRRNGVYGPDGHVR